MVYNLLKIIFIMVYIFSSCDGGIVQNDEEPAESSGMELTGKDLRVESVEDITEKTGVKTTARGVWGGHQSRLVRTPDGIFSGMEFKETASVYIEGGGMMEYSGLCIAASRGGTKLNDYIDCVYPCPSNRWIYFRLYLK